MSTTGAASTITLKGEPILSFADDLWSDVWNSRHHLITRLARENPVLFASGPFYIRDALQHMGRKDRAPTGFSKITDKLYSYVPPRWLPYNYRSPRLNRMTAELRIQQVQRTLNRLGMKHPILYIWHPWFADMVGRFDESLVVYHCVDEYSAFPSTDHREVQAQEEALLPQADIVFVASKSIYELKRPFNTNTHIVRNAADYPLFATAQDPETEVPKDLLTIPRPIIGCVTRVVDRYFNVPLMRQVFSQRPDWSLVVVGPVVSPEETRVTDQRRELEALIKLPNVHLLGRRAQVNLPGYLKGFDVCLMAYPMIENVLHSESPLKMYEYLAAGKPIVSTQLPLISHLDEVISFAHGADEWVGAIENALNENTPEKIVQRQTIARQNTWDQRATFISNKIAEELTRRRRTE